MQVPYNWVHIYQQNCSGSQLLTFICVFKKAVPSSVHTSCIFTWPYCMFTFRSNQKYWKDRAGLSKPWSAVRMIMLFYNLGIGFQKLKTEFNVHGCWLWGFLFGWGMFKAFMHLGKAPAPHLRRLVNSRWGTVIKVRWLKMEVNVTRIFF